MAAPQLLSPKHYHSRLWPALKSCGISAIVSEWGWGSWYTTLKCGISAFYRYKITVLHHHWFHRSFHSIHANLERMRLWDEGRWGGGGADASAPDTSRSPEHRTVWWDAAPRHVSRSASPAIDLITGRQPAEVASRHSPKPTNLLPTRDRRYCALALNKISHYIIAAGKVGDPAYLYSQLAFRIWYESCWSGGPTPPEPNRRGHCNVLQPRQTFEPMYCTSGLKPARWIIKHVSVSIQRF